MRLNRREALVGAVVMPAAYRGEPAWPTSRPSFPVPHGLAGNGESDDTNAIQQAIDALAGTGGTVFLPPGIYRTSRPLIMRSGVSILGAGRHYEHGPTGNRFTGSWIKAGSDGLVVHSIQDCTFSDFGIDCAQRRDSIAISLGSDNNPACKGHVFEKISIFGAGLGVRWGLSNKLAAFEQCDEITFRDIRLHSCVDGFRLDAANGSDFSRIERVALGELSGTAFDLRSPGFMTIQDCAAGTLGEAVMFRVTGGSPDPVRIIGCQSEPAGKFLVAQGPNDQGTIILEGNVINCPVEAKGILRVVSRANYVNTSINLDGFVRWKSYDDVWNPSDRQRPLVEGGAQFHAVMMRDAAKLEGLYLPKGTRIEGDDLMTGEIVVKAGIYRAAESRDGKNASSAIVSRFGPID